jgi:hypothetical protein
MSERKNAYQVLRTIVEEDTGLIYGKTGSGKSQFLTMAIREAVALDKKVALMDTEGNYSGDVKRYLMQNTTYTKTPDFEEVFQWALDLDEGYDLVVLDSFGAPVLGEFALASLKQRGDMLLKGEALAYTLKKYAQKNNCMVLVSNQPVSEMGKARDFKSGELKDPLEPFGGKANFFWKEVVWIGKVADGLVSKFDLTTYKSRHMPTNHKLGTFSVSNSGIDITFAPYMGTKGKDLPPISVTVMENGTTPPQEPPKRTRKRQPKKEESEPEKTKDMEVNEGEDDKDSAKPDEKEEIGALQKQLAALCKEGEVKDAMFTAIAYGADLGEANKPEDLKSIDALNAMIQEVNFYTTNQRGEGEATQPASLLDGVGDKDGDNGRC